VITALIFDLDNCLAPADEVGHELFEPAFEAMRQANQGTLPENLLERAFAEIWRHPMDWVAAKYGFSETILAAGWRVFVAMEVGHPMNGYGDLDILAELPSQRFLVTSGFRRLQESKIVALRLAPLFTEIQVDAIDEPSRLGKQGLFQKILKDYRLAPTEVLVVGDTTDSEIAVGNRLGMKTVQTLRSGVPRAEEATFHIESLSQLSEILDLVNKP
jgi:putative hydrolase of the HAD superfamily